MGSIVLRIPHGVLWRGIGYWMFEMWGSASLFSRSEPRRCTLGLAVKASSREIPPGSVISWEILSRVANLGVRIFVEAC